MNLVDQVVCLEYLGDEEIRNLYTNCKALVMPSLIGYSSLPLYEAFYYKKPVFYTAGLLDKSLKEFVTEIDIENPENLAQEINNIENNIEKINEKKKNAYHYFIKNLSDEKIKTYYTDLFMKIKKQMKIYR